MLVWIILNALSIVWVKGNLELREKDDSEGELYFFKYPSFFLLVLNPPVDCIKSLPHLSGGLVLSIHIVCILFSPNPFSKPEYSQVSLSPRFTLIALGNKMKLG